jgi:hypothetical protein
MRAGRPHPSVPPKPLDFSVYLTQQTILDPDCAQISPIWAKRAIAAELAVKCGQSAIRLTVRNMKWREAKAIMRGNPSLLNPAGYHVAPYNYPLPYSLLRHYQHANFDRE